MYYDFNVPINGDDTLEDRLNFECRLGFKNFVISQIVSDPSESLNVMKDLQKVISNLKIKAYCKITLRTEEDFKIKRFLKLIRGKVDVLSIEPKTIQSLRLAGRDRRVDTIIVNDYNFKWLDRSQARLMRNSGTSIEVQISRFIHDLTINRCVYVLNRILRFIETYRVPLVISLGAKSMYEIKSPKQIIYTLRFLGLSKVSALNSLTLTPKLIIDRSLHRRSSKHVAEGVDIL